MEHAKKGYCEACGDDHPEVCGKERPLRKVFCSKDKGHEGSCNALVWWEDE